MQSLLVRPALQGVQIEGTGLALAVGPVIILVVGVYLFDIGPFCDVDNFDQNSDRRTRGPL